MENQITPPGAHEPGIMTPEVTMIVLTWVAFIALLIILHKYAWKPILSALQAREDDIRQAVETAEKAKQELAKIQETREQILAEATAKSKELIEQSRHAAVEAAKVVERKNREEAKILIENAQREIKAEVERAQAELKAVTAEVAISIASKLIEENLDNEKNRKLVSQLMREI